METMKSEQDILLTVQQLRPMDNPFMHCLMEENRELLTMILQIFMRRYGLVIREVSGIGNGNGPDRAMDILVTDPEGFECTIDLACIGTVQPQSLTERRDSLPYFIKPALRPRHVSIRVVENDLFGEALPFYRMEAVDCGEESKQQTIYINGAYSGDSAIGCLMHDFRCTRPEDMLIDGVVEATRHYKQTEDGIQKAYSVYKAQTHAQAS